MKTPSTGEASRNSPARVREQEAGGPNPLAPTGPRPAHFIGTSQLLEPHTTA
jgi:hypothetical protein